MTYRGIIIDNTFVFDCPAGEVSSRSGDGTRPAILFAWHEKMLDNECATLDGSLLILYWGKKLDIWEE